MADPIYRSPTPSPLFLDGILPCWRGRNPVCGHGILPSGERGRNSGLRVDGILGSGSDGILKVFVGVVGLVSDVMCTPVLVVLWVWIMVRNWIGVPTALSFVCRGVVIVVVFWAFALLALCCSLLAMKVLVACEFSGTVRDAFIRRGHDAVSCDLLPTESDGPHIQGDVLEVLDDGWDLMIAHPPCTYLCSSGLHWNKRKPERERKTEAALAMVGRLLGAPVSRIALENPVGRIGTAYRKADQTVHPWQFGHDASKATCLWLKGLPRLEPTRIVEPRITPDGKRRWGNQTDSGQNRLGPSEDRWKKRSVTYKGLAEAMAEQWGSLRTEATDERD